MWQRIGEFSEAFQPDRGWFGDYINHQTTAVFKKIRIAHSMGNENFTLVIYPNEDYRTRALIKNALGTSAFDDVILERIGIFSPDKRLHGYFLNKILSLDPTFRPYVQEICDAIRIDLDEAYPVLPTWIYTDLKYVNTRPDPIIKSISLDSHGDYSRLHILFENKDGYQKLNASISLRCAINLNLLACEFMNSIRIRVESENQKDLIEFIDALTGIAPELTEVLDGIMTKLGKVFQPILTAVQKLNLFAARPVINSIINVINMLELGVLPHDRDNVVVIRNELLAIVDEEQNNNIKHNGISLADAAYECLLMLADIAPMNDEDPISLEPIESDNLFLSSTGFRFDIQTLAQHAQTIGRFQNSLNRDDFKVRDEQRAQVFALSKGLMRNVVQTPAQQVQGFAVGGNVAVVRSYRELYSAPPPGQHGIRIPENRLRIPELQNVRVLRPPENLF